jgi:hypothetical protein
MGQFLNGTFLKCRFSGTVLKCGVRRDSYLMGQLSNVGLYGKVIKWDGS